MEPAAPVAEFDEVEAEEDEDEGSQPEPVSSFAEIPAVPTFVASDSRPPAPVEFEPGNAW